MPFSSILSHDSLKRRLIDMVETGRVPHALLIHGPSGTGKFLLARALAERIHCLEPTPDGDACGRCRSCRQHASFNHVDMLYVFPVVKREGGKATVSDDFAEEFHDFVRANPYMDPDRWSATFDKKNARPWIFVDEASLLENRMAITPAISHHKIALVWLPERMREETANKLLKLMEEPFAGTVFILVSNDVSGVLPTIRSRCQPIEVARLSDGDVAAWLASERGIDAADARAAAHIAEGDVNAALRVCDATSVSRLFFDNFKRLMRLAYQRDVRGLKEWSADIAALGRESELKFYEFCQRLIRENFVYNFGISDLNYLTRDEEAFSRNFARFVSERNAPAIVAVMDRAMTDIAGNGNGKIINFDVAVKMIMLIKNC